MVTFGNRFASSPSLESSPTQIAGLQDRPRADAHAFADDAMRPDVRGGIHFGARRNDGRRVNSGGEFPFGKKQRHGLGERDAGIRHANQNFPVGFETAIGDDGRCGALLGQGEIILVFGKCEVAGFGAGRRGQSP